MFTLTHLQIIVIVLCILVISEVLNKLRKDMKELKGRVDEIERNYANRK